MEEKYNGTFEYISERDFNNGLNGEAFLQGKEYMFKDEEGILFSGCSVTSRNSPNILSTSKDTIISDNYIQQCAYAMCTFPIDTITIEEPTNYLYYKIKTDSMDQDELKNSSQLATCVFFTAREKVKGTNSLENVTVTIQSAESYNFEYVIHFYDLPEEIQSATTIEVISDYLTPLVVSYFS